MKKISNINSYTTNVVMNNGFEYRTSTSEETLISCKTKFRRIKYIVKVNFAQNHYDTDEYEYVQFTTNIQISNISSITTNDL